MNVILFGATGMVGQGALRECLLDPDVERVLVVVRSTVSKTDPKLREIIVPDLFDLSSIDAELGGYDACLYALGITSAGMTEADYRRITRDLTVSIAETLLRKNPRMTFVFISGASSDSTEKGSVMWARVKGEAENAVLKMPFKAVYVLRPAVIQPLHGIASKTAAYRILYVVARPIFPIVKWLFPKYVTTTERLGRAMLVLAKEGEKRVGPRKLLENAELDALAGP